MKRFGSYALAWTCVVAAFGLVLFWPLFFVLTAAIALLIWPLSVLLTDSLNAGSLYAFCTFAVPLGFAIRCLLFALPGKPLFTYGELTLPVASLECLTSRLETFLGKPLSLFHQIHLVNGTRVRIKSTTTGYRLELGWLLLGSVTWDELCALIGHQWARQKTGGWLLDRLLDSASLRARGGVWHAHSEVFKIFGEAMQLTIERGIVFLRHWHDVASDGLVDSRTAAYLHPALKASGLLARYEQPYWEKIAWILKIMIAPKIADDFHLFVLERQSETPPSDLEAKRLSRRLRRLPPATEPFFLPCSPCSTEIFQLLREDLVLMRLRGHYVLDTFESSQMLQHGVVFSWVLQRFANKELFRDLTVADIGYFFLNREQMIARLGSQPGHLPDPNLQFTWILHLAASAVGLALVERGFTIHNPSHELITFNGPTGTLAPHPFLAAINQKDLTPDDWLSACDRLGIGHLPLVRV